MEPMGSEVPSGAMVFERLFGAGSPLFAGAAGAMMMPDTVSATSGANGNRNQSTMDHSGWNVNFGEGSITSSATREGLSQWIGIAAGVVTILVALKVVKG